ncbi:MAG: DUF5060 domain-containing protein [Ignavibacteriae bacterium]|nr:MAG: DUF5060 domain-containing protein [Ignavibacteriota bacterium]
MKSIISILLCLVSFTLFAEVPSVEKWDRFEITLDGPKSGNPFNEVKISAAFTNEENIIIVTGFYDGNGRYKVRFMPTKIGVWNYNTKSNVKILDNVTGTFNCIAPSHDNHGPVKVRNKYHFGYGDGTPYWQVGTTCYAWVHQTEELQLHTLKTLKKSPFNKIRMCVFPKDYVYNKNEPPFYPFPRDEKGKNDFTKFNPEFFQHFESRILDLLNLGIEADIILFHPYDRWGYQSMGSEVDEYYLKYVIARFSSYRNVWWSLANEFDFMADKKMLDWHHIYKVIVENDPYSHLASIHNGAILYDHTLPWVSHASLQSSSLDKGAEWRAQYQKPVIFDECRYEGNINEGWGNQSAQEMVHKFWLGTIRGCYVGHSETYKHPEDILWWSKGGVLYGESPSRIAFFKSVLEAGLEDGIDPIDDYSGGKVGEYYLYYFGTDTPNKWKLNLPKNINFQIELIDAWEMTIKKIEGEYSGECSIDLPGKPYQALRVQKTGYNFPIAPVKIAALSGFFYKSADIKLYTSDNLEIRYTLDGSTPTKESLLYKKPIKITNAILLKAVSFNKKSEQSDVVSMQFTNKLLSPVVENENVSPRIQYNYYEGQWGKLPDFDKLNAVESKIVSEIKMSALRQLDHFGLTFDGYIDISKEGIYTFYCSSDDGTRLWIDDTLIVDNDGQHAVIEIGGQIGLEKGLHKIKVHFFENEGGEALKVQFDGPSIEKQEIPKQILKH